MKRLREDLGYYKAQSVNEQLLLEKYHFLASSSDAYRKATGKFVALPELCTIDLFRDTLLLKSRSQRPEDLADYYLQEARILYDAAFEAHFRIWQRYWTDYEKIVIPQQEPNSSLTISRNSKNKAELWNNIKIIVEKLKTLKSSRPDKYHLTDNWSKEFEDYEDLFNDLDKQLKYMTDTQVAVEKELQVRASQKQNNKNYNLAIIGILVTIIIALVSWIFFNN